MTQRTTRTYLDVLGSRQRGAQCHGDITGYLISSNRNHGCMAYGTSHKYRNIRCSAADIHQTDPECFFIFGHDRSGRGQGLQNQLLSFQATASYTSQDILRR